MDYSYGNSGGVETPEAPPAPAPTAPVDAVIAREVARPPVAPVVRRGRGRPAPSFSSISPFKRAFDLLAAFSVLVFASPLMLLIAIAIRIQDGGPVIFRHERIGLNNKRFGCFKFRTMYEDAGARLDAYLAANPEAADEWRRDQKLREDPRVIGWIGRFLRKSSLDELPQIINIIRGEMSLVGPRPIVDAEVEKYDNYFRYYTSVLPGVTGLWQVSGRNDISYEKRVRLDALYARKWSLGFDLLILWRTIPAVLLRRGAY